MHINGKVFFSTGKTEAEKAWDWLQHSKGKLYNIAADYVEYRDPEYVRFWYGAFDEGITSNKLLTKRQFIKEFEHVELAEDWGIF